MGEISGRIEWIWFLVKFDIVASSFVHFVGIMASLEMRSVVISNKEVRC